ncbi:hypothetical protein I6A60_06170 [Frankia sp. AgB1.9]|nr:MULTISPECIES: hypothetical protein [unclassified Frankia]MBL7547465.1 hypothetical protein [Frankia sp. AgB1.9]
MVTTGVCDNTSDIGDLRATDGVRRAVVDPYRRRVDSAACTAAPAAWWRI